MKSKIMPLQWIIFTAANKTYRMGQVMGGHTDPEGNWKYRIEAGSDNPYYIEEARIDQVLKDGEWVSFS
jgi:hypothetical protein